MPNVANLGLGLLAVAEAEVAAVDPVGHKRTTGQRCPGRGAPGHHREKPSRQRNAYTAALPRPPQPNRDLELNGTQTIPHDRHMERRRTGGLMKGFAWLFLAAGVLPTFFTEEQPLAEVTTLSIGVPWSPWLVYRESWSRQAIAAAPALDHQTVIEPRSWSSAAALIGTVILLASRFIAPRGKNTAAATPALDRRTTVLRV